MGIALHYEFRKYYQSTSNAHAKALQSLKVHCRPSSGVGRNSPQRACMRGQERGEKKTTDDVHYCSNIAIEA